MSLVFPVNEARLSCCTGWSLNYSRGDDIKKEVRGHRMSDLQESTSLGLAALY